MPFRVSLEAEVLRVELFGTLTREDLSGLTAESQAIEGAQASTPHRLTDASRLTHGEVGFEDFFAIAQRRRTHALANSIKSAIVAPDAVHYGFARMFQTLNEHPQVEVRIFGSRHSALEWIRS